MMIQLLAVQGGNDILNRGLNQVQQTYEVWDKIWESTFTSFTTGSSYYLINYIASFVGCIAAMFWLAAWARDLAISNNWYGILPRFLWVVTVLIFMSNHGQRLADLSMGFHALIGSWQTSVLQIQITGNTLQSVLNDQLATSGVKDAISQRVQQCNQLPAPSVAVPSLTPPADTTNLTPSQQQVYAKLACYQNVANDAQQLQQQYEQTLCTGEACPGIARFISNVKTAVQKAESDAQAQGNPGGPVVNFASYNLAFANVALTSVVDAIIKQVLYSLQWIFANLMQMGEWLTALSGPIALAMSLIPMDTFGLPVWGWLVSFFSFGLMQLYYTLILGISASLIAGAQNETLNDLSFAFLLGLFAPLIATALATGGAIVAIRGLASNGAQLVRGGISLASSVATSVIGIVPFL
jgi:hypothetical protein